MVDVRFRFPRLFKVFEDLFGVNAESMLIDVCTERHFCVSDTSDLAAAFYWKGTSQGGYFWESQYVIHRCKAYPHG